MSEFSISPEHVRAGAQALFAVSEAIYESMKLVADDTAKLDGTVEAAGFTGISECIEASRAWEGDCIAVHRADIEELAMNAAVCAETSQEVDGDVSSAFGQYTDAYFPDGRTAPAPERPGPDPSAQLPRGERVAV
ncbi:hypothetical protein [Glycomyces terrestris]|uniref:Uncharacterized protein n=1 Tax=Glycomyces terrestris TaxID=2493553 RepID=A0A426UWX6_9ACTN|nr:hypothetical protein [Glycomyces terrestris]RRR99131.1 hypothetical protein EIW28_10295 [Glycomyces terrestris]